VERGGEREKEKAPGKEGAGKGEHEG
jgi:hypothetical protein